MLDWTGGPQRAAGSAIGARTLAELHRPLMPWRGFGLVALVAAAALAGGSFTGSGHLAPARVQIGAPHQTLLSLPGDAQAPVSSTLGAQQPAYRVSARGSSFAASNPAEHLQSTFAASGVTIATGSARLGLRLQGIGFGSALKPLGRANLRAHANRVSYARAGVSEWYANGPLGLEQGFAIPRAPAGGSAGPLTLSLALAGNTVPALGAGGSAIVLSRSGRPVLLYRGLSASDARGRALRSWLELRGGALLIHVDARGARYPLRIDPFVQQGEKLTGAGEIEGGQFGFSVALSADGNTALIGGAHNNASRGAVWVFTRAGSVWTLQKMLSPAGLAEFSYFGESVSLSADGNTALIGGDGDSSGKGAAWVYVRSGSTWQAQGAKLTGAGESGPGAFGLSAALSADGNTAVIGGAVDNSGAGAAWIFARSGSTWSQQGSKLTGAAVSEFGVDVAMSGDGQTALIGAQDDKAGEGSAAVFVRAGEEWLQQGAVLTGAGEVGKAGFGITVALSGDGSTALVGGLFDNGSQGAAWVFTRAGTTWSQQGEKLTGGGAVGVAYFGHSVALSASGDMAIIGGMHDDEARGAAWVFTRSGGEWTQQGSKITSGLSGFPHFGYSAALSADASTALVGATGVEGEVGAVLAFEYQSPPVSVTGEASEVTTKAGTLGATVNPSGATVTSCEFEYGMTTSYGSTVACSAMPGSGNAPVAVTAALGGLSENTTYHFRILATSSRGTAYGSDSTLTTLLTDVTATTVSEATPAEAVDGELKAVAAGGTGSVTAGVYGSNIGGPPVSRSTGNYFDVYRSAGSTFKKVEVKDCELGGGRTLWWYAPGVGWEPVAEPPAVYTEGGTPCFTVTFTESTRPKVAQLTGTRFGTRFGDQPGGLEFGKCVAVKGGSYADGSCQAPSSKPGKGKYQWYTGTVECVPKKNGYYADSACQSEDVKKGKAKGKYERASTKSTGVGGSAKFEIASVGMLECKSSAVSGTFVGQKTGLETIVYAGCALNKAADCSSQGLATGTIRSFPLEAFIEEEGPKVQIEYFQDPVMAFSCGGEEYVLRGGVRGELHGGVNTMARTRESIFSPGVGEQQLMVKARKGGEYKTTMTATFAITGAQENEIDTTF